MTKTHQCQKTIKAATHYRPNQELKFPCVKKKKTERATITNTSRVRDLLQNSWHIIQSSIDSKLQRQMESHYNNHNKKLDCLQAKQRRKTRTRHSDQEQQFYPRTKKSNKYQIHRERNGPTTLSS